MLFKKLPILTIALLAAGCGFQPIYGTSTNSVFTAEMREIEIAQIPDRIGQQLRNELEQQITPKGRARVTNYILKVSLSESKQGLAVKKSEIATRSNLTVRANYQVIEKTSGRVLTNGSSRMITSYNELTQTFATLMAEKNARERAIREISLDITSKIAAFFKLKRNKVSTAQ